jgi:LPXTG-motif cell wall-anchored protein
MPRNKIWIVVFSVICLKAISSQSILDAAAKITGKAVDTFLLDPVIRDSGQDPNSSGSQAAKDLAKDTFNPFVTDEKYDKNLNAYVNEATGQVNTSGSGTRNQSTSSQSTSSSRTSSSPAVPADKSGKDGYNFFDIVATKDLAPKSTTTTVRKIPASSLPSSTTTATVAVTTTSLVPARKVAETPSQSKPLSKSIQPVAGDTQGQQEKTGMLNEYLYIAGVLILVVIAVLSFRKKKK